MDEVLITNFMIFQDAVEQGGYDLVIADEAWDIDHYWHEHPELKKAKLAWFTDFVGYVPMPSGGEHEAFLTTDYNAEMIEHIERHPGVRDRAIFVGNPEDIVPHVVRHRTCRRCATGCRSISILPATSSASIPRASAAGNSLRERLGYRDDERVCIVTVGGSGVGAHLIRRILQSYPMVQAKLPELRMIVVAGPRIDPASLAAPAGRRGAGFRARSRSPSCGLRSGAGAGRAHHLHGACGGRHAVPLFSAARTISSRTSTSPTGSAAMAQERQMEFAASTPDMIADAMMLALSSPDKPNPVEADGARRAARMIAELLA